MPSGKYISMTNDGQRNDTDSNQILSVSFANSDNFEMFNILIRESVELVFKKNDLPVLFIPTDNGFVVVNDKSIDIKLEAEELVKMEMTEEPSGETYSNQVDGNLFSIDVSPVINIASSVPSYKRSFQTVLDDEKVEKDTQENDILAPRPSNNCFNCGGEHILRDCPLPKNTTRIMNARTHFNNKSERYHLDVDQKFSHIKPGKLTKQLRHALGLKDRELPPFVYRMRSLGYPPGWLEDAKITHSGITIIDSSGNQIVNSDEEDGEVDIVRDKYDVTKIIKIPGFNVDPPSNMHDDSKFYRVPQMLPEHRIDNFIKSLNGTIAKGYKKKKLKDFPSKVSDDKLINNSHVDMEIEDVIEDQSVKDISLPIISHNAPPLPRYAPPTEPNPPPPPQPHTYIENTEKTQQCPIQNNTNKTRDSNNSPTLEYLKEEKRRILTELKNSLKTAEQKTADDISIDEVIDLDDESNEMNQSLNNKNIVESYDISVENTSTCRNNDSTENYSPIHGFKKNSFLGTPLLKFSPYESLPTGEEFSKGVSDVINFENLPDSTGKYEQMKGVIEKVRKVAVKLYAENE